MAIHTFGGYLDFHPHLHALVADGFFARSWIFHVMHEVSPTHLEELLRAKVINSAQWIISNSILSGENVPHR